MVYLVGSRREGRFLVVHSRHGEKGGFSGTSGGITAIREVSVVYLVGSQREGRFQWCILGTARREVSVVHSGHSEKGDFSGVAR